MSARDWLWQLTWAAIAGALAGSFIAAAGPVIEYIMEGKSRHELRPATVFAFAIAGALVMIGIVVATRLTER